MFLLNSAAFLEEEGAALDEEEEVPLAHFNPYGVTKHSCHAQVEASEKHMGDFGNFIADDTGTITIDLFLKEFPLELVFGHDLILLTGTDNCLESSLTT